MPGHRTPTAPCLAHLDYQASHAVAHKHHWALPYARSYQLVQQQPATVRQTQALTLPTSHGSLHSTTKVNEETSQERFIVGVTAGMGYGRNSFDKPASARQPHRWSAWMPYTSKMSIEGAASCLQRHCEVRVEVVERIQHDFGPRHTISTHHLSYCSKEVTHTVSLVTLGADWSQTHPPCTPQ